MSESKIHKHHIIPEHMGGTDHPDNLVEVTVEKHAELHKQLWEDLGCEEDRVAWLCLSGQISMTEASHLAIVAGRRKCVEQKLGIHSTDFDTGAATRDTIWMNYSGTNRRIPKLYTQDYLNAGWKIGKTDRRTKKYEELYKEFIVKNMTVNDLATKYGVHRNAIKMQLRKLKIKKVRNGV